MLIFKGPFRRGKFIVFWTYNDNCKALRVTKTEIKEALNLVFGFLLSFNKTKNEIILDFNKSISEPESTACKSL